MLVAALAAVVSVEGRGLHASPGATVACAVPPTATVTFVTSCATVDVADAACWTPHAPTVADVVTFPAGTNATVPFQKDTYTPLSVASVYIAAGATVTLNGGAIAMSGCLNVAGSLALVGDVNGQYDNGTTSTLAFAAAQSCRTVSRQGCAAPGRCT